MTVQTLHSRTVLACLLASAALVGCNQNQTASNQTAPLPLTEAAPAPSAPAPLARALPPAPAAEIAYQDDPAQQYAYADQAADVAEALGDAPPDYSYDYDDGGQPWVWRGDGYVRVAEATPDGERYYYYDSGSSYPYLVQDDGYSYAYANGALAVIYGSDGRALSADRARARLDLAGRYLARGRGLYSAAQSRPRQAVAVQSWQDRRPAIQAQQQRLAGQQTRVGAWSAYHQAHQAQAGAQWSAERDRRTAEVQHYAQRPAGPAPAPAIAPAPGQPLPQPRQDDRARQQHLGPPTAPPSQPSPERPSSAQERGPGRGRPPSSPPARQERERPPQAPPPSVAAPAPRLQPPAQREPVRPPPQAAPPRPQPPAQREPVRPPPQAAHPAAHAPPPRPGEPPRPERDDKKPPA